MNVSPTPGPLGRADFLLRNLELKAEPVIEACGESDSGLTQKILDVPYFTQPTGVTCQSTCLKMFAAYLARRRWMTSAADSMSIDAIWKEINTGTERPDQAQNSYRNMAWWLTKNFAPPEFGVWSTKVVEEAVAHIIRAIDANYPVMVSTNHARTDGHIILVVGYEGNAPNQCDPKLLSELKFICHDPYGQFNPQLGSKHWGKKGRFDGGMSLVSGGELAPGKAVKYDYEGIRRIRDDRHSAGTYFMVSGKV